MRKALFAATVLLLTAAWLYAADEKRSFSSLKYNYVVETDLTLQDFSQAFIERVRSKHKWSEVIENTCSDAICSSTWNFMDEEAHKWKCEVVIKQSVSNEHEMVVTMEVNPVMGS
jgi:hypothetical protein